MQWPRPHPKLRQIHPCIVAHNAQSVSLRAIEMVRISRKGGNFATGHRTGGVDRQRANKMQGGFHATNVFAKIRNREEI